MPLVGPFRCPNYRAGSFLASSHAESHANEGAPKSGLEAKDGWYYLDGEKFFVNAIGYEIGARPGQNPYVTRISEPERVMCMGTTLTNTTVSTIRIDLPMPAESSRR